MPDNTQPLNISDLTEYKARSGVQMKKQLHEHANALLTKLIRSMLDEADDTLFEFSSNADTNLAQQGYLDAMREVRLKRNDIERGFFTALNNPYWSLSMNQPTPNLTVTIFNYAMSPYPDWQQKAWGASLLIMAGVLFLTICGRVFISERK